VKSLPCIVCDKPCEFFDEKHCGPDDNVYPWISGTMFEASGNFGSTIWDVDKRLLQIVICDECLEAKAEQVHVLEIHRPRLELERRIDFSSFMKEKGMTND
jgi:hypothetical protein